MKIFIDTASIEEIKKYLSWGICDGVTTNPTTYLKCQVPGGREGITQRLMEIARLIDPLPLSVQVASEHSEEIITQAKSYASWANNIVVKVPITDSKGNSFLPAISQLTREGVRVNVTAVMTFNQAMLAAKAISKNLSRTLVKGPHFISIFAGRVAEEHGVERAFDLIESFRAWLDFSAIDGVEIIVGSIRTPENIEYWSRAGGHILTIPPEALAKSLISARTKETVAQFTEDAKKALQ